jgi:hypothetical protein
MNPSLAFQLASEHRKDLLADASARPRWQEADFDTPSSSQTSRWSRVWLRRSALAVLLVSTVGFGVLGI